MMPQRIQRKRIKGWRMPEGAIYVGRPTKWGNPFTMAAYRDAEDVFGVEQRLTDAEVRAGLVSDFRSVVTLGPDSAMWQPGNFEAVLAICAGLDAGEIAGRDLACWCPLDQPCHADVLLELANGGDHG